MSCPASGLAILKQNVEIIKGVSLPPRNELGNGGRLDLRRNTEDGTDYLFNALDFSHQDDFSTIHTIFPMVSSLIKNVILNPSNFWIYNSHHLRATWLWAGEIVNEKHVTTLGTPLLELSLGLDKDFRLLAACMRYRSDSRLAKSCQRCFILPIIREFIGSRNGVNITALFSRCALFCYVRFSLSLQNFFCLLEQSNVCLGENSPCSTSDHEASENDSNKESIMNQNDDLLKKHVGDFKMERESTVQGKDEVKKRSSNKLTSEMTILTLEKENDELRLCLTIALDEDKENLKNKTDGSEKGLVLANTIQQNGYQFTMLNRHKNLASPKQTNLEGAIHLSRNHVFHERTKHINVRYHFIREVLEAKTVEVLKVGTEHNVADALTKVVPGHKLQHCLELLSVGIG
ncbi:hypothetical protein Tco_0452278 [Tanacetum coccineum]